MLKDICLELELKITKRKAKTEKETVAIETYLPKTKFMLGKCYEEGIGTAKNPKEAFKFYLETAQSDFEETIAEILKDASYKTALFYFDGTGTNQDRNEAKLWYEKSAEYGHITAKKMLEHWEKYNAIPDKYESLAWHKKLAEQGNAEAQNILGTISENQYRTSHQKNKKAAKEAFQWYKKSAEQGNAEGEYNLARCYYEGMGIEKNEANAFSYFTKSAEFMTTICLSRFFRNSSTCEIMPIRRFPSVRLLSAFKACCKASSSRVPKPSSTYIVSNTTPPAVA